LLYVVKDLKVNINGYWMSLKINSILTDVDDSQMLNLNGIRFKNTLTKTYNADFITNSDFEKTLLYTFLRSTDRYLRFRSRTHKGIFIITTMPYINDILISYDAIDSYNILNFDFILYEIHERDNNLEEIIEMI
jgi:hypothetical protein